MTCSTNEETEPRPRLRLEDDMSHNEAVEIEVVVAGRTHAEYTHKYTI